MNAKISVFVFCVEAVTYLSLYNFHDCNFKVTWESMSPIFEMPSTLCDKEFK